LNARNADLSDKQKKVPGMRSTFPQRRAAGARNTQNNAKAQDRLNNMAARFRSAMAQQDYAQAARCCESVLAEMPNNLQIRSDYALCLMRLQEYDKAYKTYRRIYQSPQRDTASETWLDGFTEACGWLNKFDEVRRYGCESLNLADARFSQTPAIPLPETAPKPFDARHPQKNIISFSLYGAQPRYCETMVKNAQVARELFPHWTCRVYLDNSVPEHVWRRLREHGAQLVDMSAENSLFPTLWRFLVASDPNIDRFIVRDADSLLSEREQAAVEAWQSSTYFFHHMRDYFTHTELLLAGMWGGCTGVIPDIDGLMRGFIAQYQGSARFTDQYFLRSVLWSTVKQSLLSHDELFGFADAQPWPAHETVRWPADTFHVGSNAGYSALGGISALPDGATQPVILIMEDNEYRYDAGVKAGQWRLGVPFFIAEGVRDGAIKTRLIDN
jgi:tetratricopeptide (TPR) repeat protein